MHLDLQTSYKVTNTTKCTRKVLKNLLQGTYRIRGRGEIFSLTFPNMVFVILVPSLPLLRKRKILQIKLAKCLQCLSLQCIRADSMLANRDRVRAERSERGGACKGRGPPRKKRLIFPPFQSCSLTPIFLSSPQDGGLNRSREDVCPLAHHESQSSEVRASNRYLEGHGFHSRWGLRKFFF